MHTTPVSLLHRLCQPADQPARARFERFRGWLRTVLLNHWRTSLRRRTEQPLDEKALLAQPDEQAVLTEKEYRDYLIGRAFQVRQTDCQPATWQACWEHVARGWSAAEVATELGLTVKVVYLAKARVLRRLRECGHKVRRAGNEDTGIPVRGSLN